MPFKLAKFGARVKIWHNVNGESEGAELNKRRKLIIALGASALLAPFGSFAQQRKIWRIGILKESKQSTDESRLAALKGGLSALGYVEGADYLIETRSAQSNFARLPELAAELITLKVDVIVTSGTPSALAASRITQHIPIVMPTVGDPVGSGLVDSLRHPGRNVTGLSTITLELVGKRLELLRQLLPQVRRVGLLYDPNNQIDAEVLKRFEADCARLKLHAIRAAAPSPDNISKAFVTLKQQRAQGLLVTSSGTNNSSQEYIIQQSAEHRLPTIYSRSDYGEAGGLISYSPDFTDMNRRAATYIDKIFKGAKPGELPIEQPAKFDFVLNMKTAKALGIKIPQLILVQATKVIE